VSHPKDTRAKLSGIGTQDNAEPVLRHRIGAVQFRLATQRDVRFGATSDVRYGPIADIIELFDHFVGAGNQRLECRGSVHLG
jgi:hypothetical protein